MIRVVLASAALLTFASLSLATPLPAHAADTPAAAPEQWNVEVALVEKNGDTFRSLVAVTERGCAATESHRTGQHVKLTVCRDPGGGSTAPFFRFSVERARGDQQQAFEVAARPEVGQPTVIGRLALVDGTSTEVRATVTR